MNREFTCIFTTDELVDILESLEESIKNIKITLSEFTDKDRTYFYYIKVVKARITLYKRLAIQANFPKHLIEQFDSMLEVEE